MKWFLSVAFLMGLASAAQAETVLTCGVNKAKAAAMAPQVSIFKNFKGDLKANVTLNSKQPAKTFALKEVAPGIYQGLMPGKKKALLKLFVSKVPAENNKLVGSRSQMEVIYPDTKKKSGVSQLKTSAQDQFVCGDQIRNLRKVAINK